MLMTEMEPDLLATDHGTADSDASYGIALRPLSFFRQSEQVDFEGVWLLADLIASDGRWRKPIVVESTQGIIMDGNHRLRAAMRLGLRAVPCILLRYGDPRVRVRDWNTGEPFEIARIFQTIAAGALFPYKTTRHFFEPRLPDTAIPLAQLKGA
ncbi:ParB N-terminal domain-containing protein [Cupriavidus necator]|uniref:Transcriptional regulator n=2 Tax=Cupriavidus necator TaxID=106590 RepID=A0A367PQ96_CUPNE|nr:ParB N-terminal domain-containing protein [Cupriavidus necator]QQX85060.1 ParB N-terminal domain-containing protein [Cupriavidus necator]RCJ09226.1 transcriptional regulator [Cupriavidus necator]